jgi:hypothetical protein
MRIIRHSVFETNSSSTHSLTIGEVKDFIKPDKSIVIKMRDMDYLFKEDPSYCSLPEYDRLKTMTTREAIDSIVDRYASRDKDTRWTLHCIINFLETVKINIGIKYDCNLYYCGKWEKEGKAAFEHITTAKYPQFDPSVYAPENDFKKKLEFLYCMALGTEGNDEPVSYEDLFEFLKLVTERANVEIEIEVPDIENCDENVKEYPDAKEYKKGYEDPKYEKAYNKYYKWRKSWIKNLSRAIIPVTEYSKKHYDRTVLEINVCGCEYPMFMELHDDCDINDLRDMFRTKKKELIDWLFDKNSGFYRFRNG